MLNNIKKLCLEYGIHPSKSKGQNFLICPDVLDPMISAGDLNSNDIVLEIGPGFGILTKKLAGIAKKVLAVELDKDLYAAAEKELCRFKNIELIQEDILKLSEDELSKMLGGSYKIIANLPYNITGEFLKKFLSSEYKPEIMVLMLQKEVAQRICAKAGKHSILSISAQFYSEPKIIKDVSKNCFCPEPEVDSAVIRLILKQRKIFNAEKEAEFFRLVRIGFSSRRKMLKNNLSNGLRSMGYDIDPAGVEDILKKYGLAPKIRAQDLCVKDWERISGEIKNNIKIQKSKLLACAGRQPKISNF